MGSAGLRDHKLESPPWFLVFANVLEKGSLGKRPRQPRLLQRAPGAPTAQRRCQEMVCEKLPPSWRMCGLCLYLCQCKAARHFHPFPSAPGKTSP